jgi:hypothetical protein
MQGRVTLLLAAGAVIAAVLAVPASAAVDKAGGFSYVTKRFEVANLEVKTFKAPCPDGTHVYSGGYYNLEGFDSGYVYHSYPYDSGDRKSKPDDGWKARLLSLSPPATWQVHAVCAKPTPKYKHGDVSLGGGLVTHTLATPCNPGLNPVSGGTSGTDQLHEVQSYPTIAPLGWTVKLDGTTPDPSELHLYVICADLPATYVPANDTVQPDTQEGQSADCPAERKHVAGGGISSNASYADAVIPASRPLRSSGVDTGAWQAYLDYYDPDNSGGAMLFTVYSVCTKRIN